MSDDFEMDVVESGELGSLASSDEDKATTGRESRRTSGSNTETELDTRRKKGSGSPLRSLPNDWAVNKLGFDFEIEYGDEKRPQELDADEGYPLYGANGVIGRSDEYLFEDPVVTVTCRGATCGNVHLTDSNSWVTNNSLVLLKKSEVNNYFLANALRYHSVERAITGSAQQQITSGMLGKMDYPVPPLSEQRKIASVLYTVDQAIQKTEEIIKREEKIYEGAKRDLLRNGYFEHSERQNTATGSYPNDWRVARGDEIFSLKSGEFLDSAKRKEDGKYPVYGGNGIMGYTDRSRVPEGTIVIGRVGAYCGNVHITVSPAWVTDNAILANELSSAIKPGFLTHMLDEAGLNRFAEQSAQPRISQSTLRNLKIPIPSEEEQKEIVASLRTVMKAIDSEIGLQKELRTLKKGLMQDLLTGGVRTADKAIHVLDEVVDHG